MNKDELAQIIASSEPNNFKYFNELINSLLKDVKETYTMVELGCAEAYYSAFFNESFKPNVKNIMVDPDLTWWNRFGKTYFTDKSNCCFYNNYVSEIVWAGWGGPSAPQAQELKDSVLPITIEQILTNSKTNFVDILHMDLQGAEYYALENIVKTNLYNKFKYIMLMTHGFNNVNYQSYIKIIKDSNINHEFIFCNENYYENGDGLIILEIKQ